MSEREVSLAEMRGAVERALYPQWRTGAWWDEQRRKLRAVLRLLDELEDDKK